MKKLVLILIHFSLFSGILQAQEVVSTSGNNFSIEGYIISWTIGEAVIHTVQNENSILTQGFHQSKLTITQVSSIDLDFLLKVYPNPATHHVCIDINNRKDLSYELYDLNGKLLMHDLIYGLKNEINIEDLSNGTYYLKVAEKNKLLKTFKIIKMF